MPVAFDEAEELNRLTAGLGGAESSRVRSDLRSGGLLSGLLARRRQGESRARRSGFLGAASRGFIGGGLARTGALEGLEDVATAYETGARGAVTDSMADYVEDKRFERDFALRQEELNLAREANQPRGLFAFLFA